MKCVKIQIREIVIMEIIFNLLNRIVKFKHLLTIIIIHHSQMKEI